MPEPRFIMRGTTTTLRMVLGIKGIRHLDIPENVTDIEHLGGFDQDAVTVSMPDRVRSLPSFGPFPDRFVHCFALLVNPGTETERTARRCGWPVEVRREESEAKPLPGAPEFLVSGGVLTAYTGDAEEIRVPEGIREIGMFAFQGNNHVRRVVLPEGVTEIRAGAFDSCNWLEEAVLPASLKRIGAFAFHRCTHLQRLRGAEPGSWEEVGPFAFSATDVSFEELPGELVPRLGWCALHGCSVGNRLVIPEGITRIPDGAFMKCALRGGVRLPQSLRDIGACAFGECALESVDLPDGLETLGGDALSYNPLPELILPRSLRGGVHMTLKYIREITIPEGVEDVQLADSIGLERVDLPDTLRSLGYFGFEHCRSLKTVRIPEGVRMIPSCCFSGCDALEKVELPSSIESVESMSAFSNDSGIRIRAVVSAPAGSFIIGYAKQNGLQWEER